MPVTLVLAGVAQKCSIERLVFLVLVTRPGEKVKTNSLRSKAIGLGDFQQMRFLFIINNGKIIKFKRTKSTVQGRRVRVADGS